jgi:hypothetical protein
MAWTGKNVIYFGSSKIDVPEKRAEFEDTCYGHVACFGASDALRRSNHFLKVGAEDDIAFVEVEFM